MTESWNTKWGKRQVRHDPPTLSEALAAAQCFSDDRDHQAEIAADLMGVSVADARIAMREMAPEHREIRTVLAPARDRGGVRTVIIERKTSRRLQPTAARAGQVAKPR